MSEIEYDILAFLLCAVTVGGGIMLMALFRMGEKRRDSKHRRRYRQDIREERRRSEQAGHSGPERRRG
jgi:hypothetical protein